MASIGSLDRDQYERISTVARPRRSFSDRAQAIVLAYQTGLFEA